MYLDYYQLNGKPFQISTDPRFLWLGEKHQEAFAVLKYGLLDNKGFLVLTGDAGTGKTTLIKALLNNLEENITVSSLFNPDLKKYEFFNYIAHTLGFNKRYVNKDEFLVDLTEFLNHSFNSNQRVLLIIDEAQRLPQELLEEIRLISNIEKPATKLINIFFVGQNEFNDLLWDARNSALRQRITMHYRLAPLSRKETDEYIRYRLQVAGLNKNIFTPAAVKEIVRFSQGYPRLINIICDHALLTGFVQEKEIIDHAIIKECAAEQYIAGGKGPEKNARQKQSGPTHRRSEAENRKTPLFIGSIAFLSFLMGIFLAALFSIHYLMPTVRTPTPDSAINAADQANDKAAGKTEPSASGFAKKGETDISRPARKAAMPPEDEKHRLTEGEARPANDPPRMTEQKTIIYFERNSNQLSDRAYRLLDQFTQTARHYPEVKVIVKGFTDAGGSATYNKRLSGFRANTVKAYLVGRGIGPARIRVEGLGLIKLTDGTNNSGRDAGSGRRVEVAMDFGTR